MLDSFASALRKIELESGRLIQAQIMFLKSADLLPFRSAVNAAVASRHEQVRKLWDDMLSGIGRGTRHRPIASDPGNAVKSQDGSLDTDQRLRLAPLHPWLQAKKVLAISEPSMKAVSAEEAIAMMPNGATVMVGGFMGVGTPKRLLDELVRQRKTELSIISAGFDVDHEPHRTQSERTKADDGQQGRSQPGASGHRQHASQAAAASPNALDGASIFRLPSSTMVDGKSFLLETALRSDFALIHSFLADYLGNLAYALTARNFNPVMAMAADTVIVTAEHIVPVGIIAPDHVVTPAPLVDFLIANG
jgi:acetate CoA/acetoacetate CoA-transferase alpha subunit